MINGKICRPEIAIKSAEYIQNNHQDGYLQNPSEKLLLQ